MSKHFKRLIRSRIDVINSRNGLSAAIGNIEPDKLAQLVSEIHTHYHKFFIPKKSSGQREIVAPSSLLRGIQRSVLDLLYNRVCLPNYLHGGLPNRSVIGHAKTHICQPVVMTVDVTEFFPSTRESHLRPLLEVLGFHDEALEDLIALVTLDGVIPQGAPSSSLLANLAFHPVDIRIRRFCKRHKIRYSRFVDDIALSGIHVRQFLGPVKQSLQAEGFQVADHKTAIMTAATTQVVTGIIVNKRPRPTSEFIKKLRLDIRQCLNYGALAIAETQGISVRLLKAQINGKVNFVKQCDRELGQKIANKLYGIDWSRIRSLTIAA